MQGGGNDIGLVHVFVFVGREKGRCEGRWVASATTAQNEMSMEILIRHQIRSPCVTIVLELRLHKKCMQNTSDFAL